jgi:hypothetical protein
MAYVIFNIVSNGTGSINQVPFVYKMPFKRFSKTLRSKSTITDLFSFSKKHYTPMSGLFIFGVYEENKYQKQFVIKVLGIREIKTEWDKRFNQN